MRVHTMHGTEGTAIPMKEIKGDIMYHVTLDKNGEIKPYWGFEMMFRESEFVITLVGSTGEIVREQRAIQAHTASNRALVWLDMFEENGFKVYINNVEVPRV